MTHYSSNTLTERISLLLMIVSSFVITGAVALWLFHIVRAAHRGVLIPLLFVAGFSFLQGVKCDVCGETAEDPRKAQWFVGKYERETLRIQPWAFSVPDAVGASHICGIECAKTFTARQLALTYGNEVTPATQQAEVVNGKG